MNSPCQWTGMGFVSPWRFLGHNDLRGVLVHVLGDLSALAGGVVGLPVKKDDNVRVLLDRAGIPQLRQAGPVVLGALGGTRSWDRAITGTFSSLASTFRFRVISEISLTRLSLFLVPFISCK